MVQSDFLVIGSGAAGLSFALSVAEYGSVTIVTKKESIESNTNYAQGGIAVATSAEDSIESHIHDTLAAGAGLCDENVVRTIITEGPARLDELRRRGARFTENASGQLDLGKEGGHSFNRIVHSKDSTGREVERALMEETQAHRNIRVLEHHFAIDLITEHHLLTAHRADDRITCFGAYVFDEHDGRVEPHLARVTMLATGGTGHVYLHTTNPSVATGDGLAMAYRARALFRHLEFMQFHPTALFHERGNSFLISEAVRGEGALLRSIEGERFMTRYDKRAELSPRDIVARAIDDEMKKSGSRHVWLDATGLGSDFLESRFPMIYQRCLSYGIDMAKEFVPIVPAAHYMCGGVQTDLDGQSSIVGLLACGEVACTGLHGANRLASNSLLEAIVVSNRAAKNAIRIFENISCLECVPEWDHSGTSDPQEEILISHNRDELQRLMTNYVGIVRSRARLKRAERRSRLLFEETEEFYRKSILSVSLCELRNLIAVAYMIIKSAKMRTESRGLHYMSDYPEPYENALDDVVLQRSSFANR